MDRDMVHGNQLMPQLCVEADIYEDNGMTTTIKTIMFPLILLDAIGRIEKGRAEGRGRT